MAASEKLRSALQDLSSLAAPPGQQYELVITAKETAINTRDLAAFLEVLDRAYAEASELTIRRYAMHRESQLKISAVRGGSWELILAQFGTELDHQIVQHWAWASVYAVAKIIRMLTQSTESAANAYKSFQEGREVSARRRQERLVKIMRNDDQFRQLEPGGLRTLAVFADKVFMRIGLKRAASFVAENVKRVTVRRRH
jgi:hypothetical protein